MNSEDNKPMDLVSTFPPKQEGNTIQNQDIHGFAVSLQGASHIAKDNIPCQDYSDIRWLEGAQILIAAIADGVGSCALSHWGAYFAVTAAMDSIDKNITKEAGGKKYELSDITRIQEILIDAFHAAQDTVEQKADEAQQAVFNLQSTLTVAIYDGIHVYCCHCGDDGVVIQEQGGIVRMVTRRLKGEEASSVYPLQSGPGKWQITGAKNPVAGFVMATDGVLDAFVPVFQDYYRVNYNEGIYYPFMKQAIYGMADMNDDSSVKKTLDYYKDFFNSSEYRRQVTDDLTLVSVVSPKLMRDSVEPRFSMNIWKTVYEEHGKTIKTLLEGKKLDRKTDNMLTEGAQLMAREEPLKGEKTAAESKTEKADLKGKEHEEKPVRDKRFLWFLAGVLAGGVLVGAITSFSRIHAQPREEETSELVVAEQAAAILETTVAEETKEIIVSAVNKASASEAEKASASEAEKASASEAGKASASEAEDHGAGNVNE